MMSLILSLLIATSFAKDRKPTQEAGEVYKIQVTFGDLINIFKVENCKVEHAVAGEKPQTKEYSAADCKFVVETLRSLPASLNESADCKRAHVEILRPKDKVQVCLRGRSPTAKKVRELVNLMALDF